MPHFMITPNPESMMPPIELKVWSAAQETALFRLDQDAPNVIAMAMFGMWSFDQEDTGQFVTDLRAFADFIERNVAR